MPRFVPNLQRRLAFKLILTVGLALLMCIAAWAFFTTRYQREKLMENMVANTERLSNTIRLGTHYAMMLNSRDDIDQTINNIAQQKEIENIRIYNKQGQIKFSSRASEKERFTNIKAEACDVCHRTDPPLTRLDLDQKTRIFDSGKGYRLLGIISPIYNDPGCATAACHVHPAEKQILGALDLVLSLEETDAELLRFEEGIMGLALFTFLVTSAIILIVVLKFVSRPVHGLIKGTQQIAAGNYTPRIPFHQRDELGELALAIQQMGRSIAEKQAALNQQMAEYQNLFNNVPCFISIQDRDYRIIQHNQMVARQFSPASGDYCYRVYKGRDRKCENCPVERTFAVGGSHYAEEAGINKDGSPVHWMVMTSPVKNEAGEIVAAMEMSLDITHRKYLEEKLAYSEKKYHAIFNNIPNPVFVLDQEDLTVLDCNESVPAVYGFAREEVLGKSFGEIFHPDDAPRAAHELGIRSEINRIRQIHREGRILFVNIRVSPSEYPGEKVLLVTTSDITRRLETEQQLIQAGKLATLGEMASGVAHELNQPLSVIKTISSFFTAKIQRGEAFEPQTLCRMLEKVDSNVDRATRIINHMRQFARKSEVALERVQINEILERSVEIFSQQLKLREIKVRWDLLRPLPMILGDAGRLEQVFINLLINARDAIEARWEKAPPEKGEKRIDIRTWAAGGAVFLEMRDTGTGIPDSMAGRIFEPFFTTKEVGKGTGLGLSISYGIIKDCGGDIAVDHEYKGGASFRIQFPVSETDGDERQET